MIWIKIDASEMSMGIHFGIMSCSKWKRVNSHGLVKKKVHSKKAARSKKMEG